MASAVVTTFSLYDDAASAILVITMVIISFYIYFEFEFVTIFATFNEPALLSPILSVGRYLRTFAYRG